LFLNATLVFLTKKTFGKCIPISMMISAITLYLSQFIFKTFKVGFYFNLIFAILIIFLLLFNLKKDSYKLFIKNYFTDGLIIFLTIYFCLVFYDYNRFFTQWDEFSHWGVMIKEMLRLDDFYSISNSTLLVHKDYPPILQLYELFCSKLAGNYKESIIIFVFHLLEISLFIPFLEKKQVKKANFFNSICLLGIVFLMLLFMDQHGIINCIYNDYFMAILIAYLICFILFKYDIKDIVDNIMLCIGLAFLLLTKQMGLPFYLMIIFLLVIKNKKLFKKNNIVLLIKVSFITIIIPLLFLGIWNNYINNLKVDKQFDTANIKINKLPKIILGNDGKQYQIDASHNYLKSIFTKTITTSYIPLSYFQTIMVGLVILYIIYMLHKKEFVKEKFNLLILILILGAIGYTFVMLNMYTFLFDSYEAPRLASFNRYMATYSIIIFSCAIMIYIEYLKKNNLNLFILLTILLIIQKPSNFTKLYPAVGSHYESIYEIDANYLNEKTDSNSKIFIIAQNTDGTYQYYIKYYSNPRFVNTSNYN
jgi:hypothetical protein